MSNSKASDMSKLRKKLEQSSKKTRRSTDLRRSLGRKSVGDTNNCDVADLEQASFSNSTLNESCHLNTDSAIIDPATAENPEWFKNLPRDIQASEESIRAAYLKDLNKQMSNESNLSVLNTSVSKRDVHKVLNCSVVVSRESIDRHINRHLDPKNVDDSVIGSSTNEDLSLELPKRKRNTLRDRLKVKGRNTLDAELKKALENSNDNVNNKGDTTKQSVASHPNPLEESFNVLPKRKPNTLRDQVKLRSRNTLDAELKKALENSDDNVDNKGDTTKQSVASHPNPLEESFNELPKRKPNTLRDQVKLRSRNTLDAELKKALENSDDNVNNKGDTTEQSVASHPNPSEESFNELPKRKPNTLRDQVKLRSRNTLDAELKKALENSDDNVNNKGDTTKQSVTSHPEPFEESLDMLPKRKPNILRCNIRKRGRESFENALRQVLDDNGYSDNSMEPTRENNPETSPADDRTSTSHVAISVSLHTSDCDASVGIAKRKQLTESSRKSFGNTVEKALDYNAHCNGDVEALTEGTLTGEQQNLFTLNHTNQSCTSKFDYTEKDPMVIITPHLEDSVDKRGNTSETMPLGAEACNMEGLSDNIRKTKHSLSLKKKKVSKCSGFSAVAEISEPELSQEKSAKKINVNYVSSEQKHSNEDSVTDITRNVPLMSIASTEVRRPTEISLHISRSGKNILQVSTQTAEESPRLACSSSKLREPQQESLLSELMPVNLSSMALLETSSVFSKHTPVTVNLTPLSTQESVLPRRISKSFQEKSLEEYVKENIPESKSLVTNVVINGGVSCDSSVSTNSVSGGMGSDSVFNKTALREGKTSHHRSASNSSKIIQSLQSGSDFGRLCPADKNQSDPESARSSSHMIESTGSDCVFIYPSDNFGKSRSSQTASFSLNTRVPRSGPEADERGPVSHRRDSSPAAIISNEGGYTEEVESFEQWENPRLSLKCTAITPPASALVNVPSRDAMSQVNEDQGGSPSSLCQTNAGLKSSAVVERNLAKPQKVGSKLIAPIKGPSKTLTESELEKMRSSLQTWMDQIKIDANSAVAGCRLVSTSKINAPQNALKTAPKTNAPQNALKTEPKTSAKKTDPDPYFGDYCPPKRVKPRPYVTDKMYKFLEKKLKVKFGLEARVRAEEFVLLLCNFVQYTIKEKNTKKYHPVVFRLRNEMVKLGLIRCQFDYHLFIQEYLPDAFRIKSIPCYGCSKAPTLDVVDLYSDLTIK